MAKGSHLKLIDGNVTRLNIPNVVEFEMKDIIDALRGLNTVKRFIKAYVSGGIIRFMATSNSSGPYTFASPLGSDPQQTMAKDRDIYETMRRYRGPLIALCRKLAELWNTESSEMMHKGFKVTKLKFNE